VVYLDVVDNPETEEKVVPLDVLVLLVLKETVVKMVKML